MNQRFWLKRVLLMIVIMALLGVLGFTIGTPVALTVVSGLVGLTVIAWRLPYYVMTLWAPLSLWLGWIVYLDSGRWQVGDTVLQVYAELTIGELLAVSLLLGWLIRLGLYWKGRRDRNWEPVFPLLAPFVLLFIAECLSVFSSYQPQPADVIKHAIRYIALTYVSCILLVSVFLRSLRRIRAVVAALALNGVFFALSGLLSVFYQNGTLGLYQAQPLSFLGFNTLGGNQNALAETLIIGLGGILLWHSLIQQGVTKRLIEWMGIGIFFVTLLTFSRSAWIALIVSFILLIKTNWSEWWQEKKELVLSAILLFSPLALVMIVYSLTNQAIGSISSRAMNASIGWKAFLSSPIIGIGAGEYVHLVGQSRAWLIDYGAPLDAHGILQKVAAETGLMGLVALIFIVFSWYRIMKDALKHLPKSSPEYQRVIYAIVLVLALGIFQLFSTSYWTPRLWLPVGLSLAIASFSLSSDVSKDPNFLTS